jgi:hypothetical protein
LCDRLFASSWFDSKIIPFQGFQSFFYNRRYFLNFRWYLKKIGQGSGARLRAPVGPGQSPAGAKLPGSSWNLAFCGPKKVLQRLQIIKWFWKKNPINFLFIVQISPRSFVVFCTLQRKIICVLPISYWTALMRHKFSKWQNMQNQNILQFRYFYFFYYWVDASVWWTVNPRRYSLAQYFGTGPKKTILFWKPTILTRNHI